MNNYAVETIYNLDSPRFDKIYSGGGAQSQTLVGWNVGGGFEWLFMANWSVKAEAIYWNMGSQSVQTASFAPAVMPSPKNPWFNDPGVV